MKFDLQSRSHHVDSSLRLSSFVSLEGREDERKMNDGKRENLEKSSRTTNWCSLGVGVETFRW